MVLEWARGYLHQGYCVTTFQLSYLGARHCATWAQPSLHQHSLCMRCAVYAAVQVLSAFEIPYPVSALELNIEPFVFDQFYGSLLQPLSD